MVKKLPLPPMNKDGALPHRPKLPPDLCGWSPHPTSIDEFVKRFALSPQRIELLENFLKHRALMRSLGLGSAFQWVNGSFVEHCEPHRPTSPRDIDVLTFAYRPIGIQSSKDFRNLLLREKVIGHAAKASLKCDSYVVDLDSSPRDLVVMVRYWFGLFSIRRSPPGGMKGFVELELDESSDDELAYQAIAEISGSFN